MSVSDRVSGGIEQRVSFDSIRYANCWEDGDILCAALRPRPGTRMLSIASAGDNVLALLAEGAEVVAADLSQAQLACLELRCAAFRRLDHAGVLAFLGVHPAPNRAATYARLAPDLSEPARTFWNARPHDIEAGIMHAGKFEAYFRLFRSRILPLVHSQRTIARLLEPRDEAGRHAFYDNMWDNWRWRLLFRVFFSRFLMGRLGRDPEFFRYVQGSVSDRILARAKHAVTKMPTHTNPYLEFILTGRLERSLPRYLRPEHFAAIQDGLGRLSWFHGPIESVRHVRPTTHFDGFNLSDIFEYIDQGTSTRIYSELLTTANPGARVAYWNTLVPRHLPQELHDRARPLTDVARQLFARDKAFFYGDFVVDEVRING